MPAHLAMPTGSFVGLTFHRLAISLYTYNLPL